MKIYDLENNKLILYNKDYRLLNDLGKDYVKENYPMFSKEFSKDVSDIIVNVFNIPINKTKLKKVKPFKKIVKKTVIIGVNNKNQILVKKLIRKRKNPNSSNK